MPNVEAKIIDPVTGRAAPRGTPGEVCTRGYVVMRGYWDDPDATAEAVDAGGWMHTGDLGVIDDEGYLNIVGRIKDMVIRGGENIYPREIEEVLFQHPAVGSAQVIGVPDAQYGEELMAWIVVREGSAVTEDELRTFCRERLVAFQGAPLLAVRRRVPDDRHRQGAEVQDAQSSRSNLLDLHVAAIDRDRVVLMQCGRSLD